MAAVQRPQRGPARPQTRRPHSSPGPGIVTQHAARCRQGRGRGWALGMVCRARGEGRAGIGAEEGALPAAPHCSLPALAAAACAGQPPAPSPAVAAEQEDKEGGGGVQEDVLEVEQHGEEQRAEQVALLGGCHQAHHEHACQGVGWWVGGGEVGWEGGGTGASSGSGVRTGREGRAGAPGRRRARRPVIPQSLPRQ